MNICIAIILLYIWNWQNFVKYYTPIKYFLKKAKWAGSENRKQEKPEKFKYEIFKVKKPKIQCSFCALSKESNTIHIVLLME